jgi:hypothetical protein
VIATNLGSLSSALDECVVEGPSYVQEVGHVLAAFALVDQFWALVRQTIQLPLEVEKLADRHSLPTRAPGLCLPITRHVSSQKPHGFQLDDGFALGQWRSIAGVFRGTKGNAVTADKLTAFVDGQELAGNRFGKWSPGNCTPTMPVISVLSHIRV